MGRKTTPRKSKKPQKKKGWSPTRTKVKNHKRHYLAASGTSNQVERERAKGREVARRNKKTYSSTTEKGKDGKIHLYEKID